jgi:CysZ protein
MIKSFLNSFTDFFGASKFIRKNKLYYFYIIPFIVSLIVYYFLFHYVRDATDMAISYVLDIWGIERFLDVHEKDWWGKILNVLTSIFKFSLGIGAFLLSMVVMKYILLAIMSPWFAYISEKTESKINNTNYPFSWSQLLKDAWRGVLISGRNFIYEISINLGCFILGLFVPFLSPILFMVNLYAGSYFYGFSMMDYVCERKKMGVKESVLYIRQNKGVSVGIGFGMWLLNYIPIIGLTYASVNGAVSASLQLNAKQ